ncbi:NAD(P)/FAD-dependent oxidoreductase [Defluviimonas sp. D31]|uniref:flavin-containing monooxygenase n=1 Tax=Defluviimonas sp. D31 TaxID=3083253 RepID=UPI00296F5EA9|nr:NAD(P)/FAD-dependent oxidoreductase [Defluviimonas sp. D31]MDW4551626.1 NAD(P)/FAD-dependent oxidoreductase [Defluviimonas sp. D31]
MALRVDTVIIGAGQAGLALSHCLTEKGIDHVVLERGRVGERWLSERWPELRLLSPNFMTRLPGLDALPAPEGFMRAGEFAGLLDAYGRGSAAPIRTSCEVLSVMRAGGRFLVRTAGDDFSARAVVVATGACDEPAIPPWAEQLPSSIRQVTTRNYTGPDTLDEGAVLIVGASATGVQFAKEIRASGRPVTIAVGRHVRSPRRYRGRDLFDWLDRTGFLYEPRDPMVSDGRSALPSFQLTGSDGGQEIGLDRLKALGVNIAGRALGASSGTVRFADSLREAVDAAEARRHRLLSMIDQYISEMGFHAPQCLEASKPQPDIGDGPTELNLRDAGIKTVVWATGFRRSYPWLRLPVFGPRGDILQVGGLTPEPGLFTLGLPFMRQRSSAFIYGTGRDAGAIAERVAAHLSISRSIAA